MRDSNHCFPSSNRASVVITSSLYDRRGTSRLCCASCNVGERREGLFCWSDELAPSSCLDPLINSLPCLGFFGRVLSSGRNRLLGMVFRLLSKALHPSSECELEGGRWSVVRIREMRAQPSPPRARPSLSSPSALLSCSLAYLSDFRIVFASTPSPPSR